jgi:hypothetical protein
MRVLAATLLAVAIETAHWRRRFVFLEMRLEPHWMRDWSAGTLEWKSGVLEA